MQRIPLCMNTSRLGFFNRSILTRSNALISPYRHVEALSPPQLFKLYGQLSKSRLTLLVVLTAMSGVALSPLHATVPTLLSTAVGTALCSASANTLNQLQEIPFDAQMARTRMRPLVRRAITPLHAAGFAVATGISGPLMLWTMVNPTTALLGAANIVLYSGVYTWMKRKTIYNTWVGSIVGALPPLMGWTACGGQLFPSSSYPIHLFLPSFIWQFPHFNGLSHLVRASYAQAGYRMLAVLSPRKNSLVALRHAVLLVPICSVLIPLSGLTTWTFALTSLVPNMICTQAAWQFWRIGGEKEARLVFRHSLWYLPVVMALMMLHKQGVDWVQWLGIWDDDQSELGISNCNFVSLTDTNINASERYSERDRRDRSSALPAQDEKESRI
ncbi:UbiA prenyltransferase family-domain-containing protein [Mycena metata]|uniref:Protoheme IX farnesyltransferase, mitochondrial n=1 Tax=Mycena metata TaxID=1033252 RepID=A0AAD7HLM1_9AGAR|nr:UbiA prenyltransferase family-domain-containing protein [Mycena metata]